MSAKKYLKCLLAIILFFLLHAAVTVWHKNNDIFYYNDYLVLIAQALLTMLYGSLLGLCFSSFVTTTVTKKENLFLLVILIVLALGKILYFVLGSILVGPVATNINRAAPYFQFTLGFWLILNILQRHKLTR